MADEYVHTISSRCLQKWLRYDTKHVKNRHFSRHFGTLPRFSEFYFLTDFDASKSVLESFLAFFAKIWPKNMYCTSKSQIFLLDLFLPGDLRWPWPLLWSQSTVNDTYQATRKNGYYCFRSEMMKYSLESKHLHTVVFPNKWQNMSCRLSA